ncbi:MAG: hypothetical protein H6719_10620 [Sandaracinaceae bacterium]|nr:hypothetical protein [Sandaracinaceae bacterium]
MDATAQELIARLRRNPNDSEAFAALRAHYQRIGDYASLANLLEGWAGRSRDPAAAAQAIYEAGELVLGALADRERAIRMYQRTLSLDPRHPDAFLRLRGLFEDSGETRRLAELLEKQGAALATAGADPRDVALLYHQLGEIWEHRFSRVDKAVNHYKKAFDLDPSFVAAIYAAREIYRAAGNMKAAATLLEKEAKAELDKGRKLALWRELAHLRSDKLDDPEGAALALKRALAEQPGDVEVMTDLARVYLTRANRTKDEHVAASDRHRAADLLYQMAQQVSADRALTLLEQALDARPDHDGAMSLYERYCDELRQRPRLPARWVAYLAHAPSRPEAAYRRKQLAQAYLDAGQVDYAITCLEWLLDEGDAEAAEHLVTLYRQVGREDDVVRALGVAAQGLSPEKRVPRLRELVAALRDRGDLAQAARFAKQILDVEPGDPEAIHVLDSSARETGDYTLYRDALLSASRISGSSAEERKLRLKQVASISEGRMGDLDGAISAWRGVAALDPSDVEARTSLKRLFSQTERWDDLVEVLEREALSHTEPEPKAEIYRQLAVLHRDRREDLESAIVALRHLRDLVPGDLGARDALGDALVRAGAYLEAIPLLRQRIDATVGPDRSALLRLLASILEDHVGDDEGAFDAWAQILDENPTDLDALSHMEAIDEASGMHERLLSTLSYKVEIIAEAERGAVLVRMGGIADQSLNDLPRAAELYTRALELAPSEPGVLDRLCEVYERSERFKDLVVLLRSTANREDDPTRRSELYRRIARTLADSVGNDDGAAEAWVEVLQAGEDEEALRFLQRHTTRKDDAEGLVDVLARLVKIVPDDFERRDMLWERGLLLADQLDRPAEAIGVLREVVAIQADHVAALQRLAALCELTRDLAGLAEALWRQLEVVEDPGLRVPVARRLAELHEAEVPQLDKAIEALYAWGDADLADPEPLERLVPLLENASRWADLTAALDSLAGLAGDEAEASELTRRAARVAYRQLGDIDGAWERLEPRIREDGDEGAEEDLRDLARGASAGERLAEMYVSMAQTALSPTDQAAAWMKAAGVYETYLKDLERALEAVLRAFAIDITDTSFLDEADRLASAGDAWPRLGQVYETLIRRAESAEAKVDLLLRHADRLFESDPGASLDQTLRACALLPLDDEVLALAEERAPIAGRAEELLITYDKRKSTATDDEGRVEALLRSARLCESTLGDRDRATHYFALAIALTVRTPELADVVEAIAKALDERPAAMGGLRRAVVEIYAALADDMEENPIGGATLLLRASRILHAELRDDETALMALKRAATFAPGHEEVLDELDRFTRHLRRLGDLDRHLAQLVEEALDKQTAAGLLRRRGDLLEELGLFGQAAEVWTRLSSVTGDGPESRERLRAALRKAGKLEDLLVALQRDLRKTEDEDEKLELRRKVARVWDEDLRNKWEALDAWKKVLKAAPGDPEAQEAIARLEEDRRRPVDSDLGIASPAPRPEPESVELHTGEILAEDLVSEDLQVDPDVVGVGEVTHLSAEDIGPLDDQTMDGAPRAEEAYADATDSTPSSESSETMYDSGLFRELGEALASNPPPAPPALPRREEPEPPVVDATPSDEEALPPLPPRETRQLDASAYLEEEAQKAEASVAMPAAHTDDFDDEDDYTAVAEDVFSQIRADLAGGAEVHDELGTGELELIEDRETETFDSSEEEVFEAIEAEGRASFDDLGPPDELGDRPGFDEVPYDVLDAVEELEDIDELEEFGEIVPLDEVEELDDELEEIDDFDELEELPGRSSAPPPPPPPRKR